MSADSDHEAEVLRLARVLGVAPGDLDVLDPVPLESVRELRDTVQDRLLARNHDQFARAVALADRVPGALAAKLAQHAMGPVLGGRAAALLTPAKAAELAHRLPPEFLAQVACHVDLRRVGGLLAGISTDTMAQAGAELRRHEEWIVLGAFVGYVDDGRLATLLDVFDGEALLRAGFVVEDSARLDPVVGLLSDGRLDELLDAAAQHDLWVQAAALVGHLGPQQSERVGRAVERCLTPQALADLVVQIDPDAVAGLLAGIGPDTVAQAGAHLRRRERWTVLGAFAAHVADENLAALLDGFDDEAIALTEQALRESGRSGAGPSLRVRADAAARTQG